MQQSVRPADKQVAEADNREEVEQKGGMEVRL